MTPYNLFSLITERLFLNTGYITLGTYHVLFEVGATFSFASGFIFISVTSDVETILMNP